MKILAIDTTTMFGSVALCDGYALLVEELLGVEVTHSERLLVTIEHLLKAVGCTKESLDAVAVAMGPGSFTGLRIGLATAKGLAMGLNKPIVGVSSLLALALNGVFSSAAVIPLIDARRGEVYGSAYRFVKLRPKVLIKEMVCEPAVMCERLKSVRGDLMLLGDGAVVYEKVFKQLLKGRAIIAKTDVRFPRASYLAAIAFERLKRGEYDDITSLVPSYLRHSDAEIGWVRRCPTPGEK